MGRIGADADLVRILGSSRRPAGPASRNSGNSRIPSSGGRRSSISVLDGFSLQADEPRFCRWHGQLHFELVASTKPLTELLTADASLAIFAICETEGLVDSAFTELVSVWTDVWIALVWLGKSPLAELTKAVASLWILSSCDRNPLSPLLTSTFLSPLMELSRLVWLEQYAGLLLPQAVSVSTATATAQAISTGASTR